MERSAAVVFITSIVAVPIALEQIALLFSVNSFNSVVWFAICSTVGAFVPIFAVWKVENYKKRGILILLSAIFFLIAPPYLYIPQILSILYFVAAGLSFREKIELPFELTHASAEEIRKNLASVSKSKVCKNCGAPLGETETICQKCGKKVE